MFRKRLDPRRLVADIHAGLDDTEIMDKYHVSRGQLRAVLKELITRGELREEDLDERKDRFFRKIRKLGIIAMFSDYELMNRLVLKGGNALDIAYSMEFRSSIDLDFSMEGKFNDDEIERVKTRTNECLKSTFRSQGYEVLDITFAERPPNVSPDMADFWGGYQIEYKLVRKSKRLELSDNVEASRRVAQEVGTSDRKTFRIEISKFEHCAPKREAELDHYTIFVYSPEQIVVEKIRSICQQVPEYGQIVKSRSQSPRPKDFLDIYVVIKHFGIDLTTPENLDLVRCSFESKRVPLRLIGRIRDYRDYHLGAFDAVKDTIYRGKDVKDFDFYFDYVVSECEKLKHLWEE